MYGELRWVWGWGGGGGESGMSTLSELSCQGVETEREERKTLLCLFYVGRRQTTCISHVTNSKASFYRRYGTSLKWYVENSICYFDAGIIIILTGSKNAQMLCNSKSNDSDTYANIQRKQDVKKHHNCISCCHRVA